MQAEKGSFALCSLENVFGCRMELIAILGNTVIGFIAESLQRRSYLYLLLVRYEATANTQLA